MQTQTPTQASTAVAYPDWHDPRNQECAHNDSINLTCTCTRLAKFRTSGKRRPPKPYRTVRVTDQTVNRGIKPRLVVVIYDDGRIIIREAKRRAAYKSTLGTIYSRMVRAQALADLEARKRELAAKRAAKKQARKGGAQ